MLANIPHFNTNKQQQIQKGKSIHSILIYLHRYFFFLDINLGSQYLDAIIIIMFQIWSIENWERAHVEGWIEHPEVQSIAKDL